MCEGAQGHYADAKHAVSRAIELGDHTFANYLNRGICSLNSGDVSAAIEDWERALVIEPDHRRAEEVRELLEKYAPDRDDRFAFGDLNLEEDKE